MKEPELDEETRETLKRYRDEDPLMYALLLGELYKDGKVW